MNGRNTAIEMEGDLDSSLDGDGGNPKKKMQPA